MIKKIFALILVAAGIGIAWLSIPHKEKPITTQSLIEDDLDYLEKHQQLPKEWSSLKNVETIFTNPNVKKILENQLPKIKTLPTGQFKLEMIITDWVDQKDNGLIIQMNLINISSNNKIWELGRTYNLSNLITNQTSEESNPSKPKKFIDSIKKLFEEF